jgi:glucose-6-phosphate 1-epimerase
MSSSASLSDSSHDGVSYPHRGDLACVRIATSATAIEAALQGAHLFTWEPVGTRPVLFTSPRTEYASGRAIRGGVPLIFPWFGPRTGHPESPAHGFARTLPWSLEEASVDPDGAACLRFRLADSPTTRAAWPHAFAAEFTIHAAHELRMRLALRNTGDAAFTSEAALHTYFAVSDVRSITVHGLEDTEYLDKPSGGTRLRQDASPIRFAGEVDRMYLHTDATVVIDDPAWKRRIEIAKAGASATVVWNPWLDRARKLADLGEENWTGFVCVETAAAAENALTLPPGATHVVETVVRVLSS